MESIVVIRNDGIQSKFVEEIDRESLLIKFNDGSQMLVLKELLIPQENGTYYLILDTVDEISKAETPESEEEVVIPVIQEELIVDTERVVRQVVQVHKRVETREETVNTTVKHQKVIVDRIPINQIIEGTAPKVRKENGVLIIPVIEEVLVVNKRLFLREEVHLSKHSTQETNPQKFLLRREVVDIERKEPDGTELDENELI